MQSIRSLMGVMVLLCLHLTSGSQERLQPFKMFGQKNQTIELNQSFTETREIFPFEGHSQALYGLAIKADITLNNENSLFRAVLIDHNFNEYLIYETHGLLETDHIISVDEVCEETGLMEGIIPYSLRIEVTEATAGIKSLSISEKLPHGIKVRQLKRELHHSIEAEKIRKINKNITDRGLGWIAGPTEISALSYDERKKLYGQSTFPPGFEYYTGGVIRSGSASLKSASSDLMVESWDWRDRHGRNWLTPPVDQSSCGSCWSFATAGATEALVNLFYNQQLNKNLSEQQLISCSGAGGCSGGIPGIALDYITNTGLIDEASRPYTATEQSCEESNADPLETFRISGKINFGSKEYPITEETLKKMLIEFGPLSSGVYDWSHAMVLAGYQVVKEGDHFYYRNPEGKRYRMTVEAGDPLIGKTVWIFKNSWGPTFGDDGYVYIETDIRNIGWTYGLLAPVKSMIQDYTVEYADKDGDGYYWWGLGPKPEGCPGPDEPDGDDSNPGLGPLDEYGRCMDLEAPPVANFSATENPVIEGESVTFSDLSSNIPTSWSWTFEGGTPASSTYSNPVVTYNTPGTYDVNLVVSNADGTHTVLKQNFITVTAYTPDAYCSPRNVNSTSDWISQVAIGTDFSNPSAGNGYSLFPEPVTLHVAQEHTVILTPHDPDNVNYWRIWIDFNGDGDFNDSGETLLMEDNKKGEVVSSVYIPDDVTGETRMRISMYNGNAPSPCDENFSGEVEDYTVWLDHSDEMLKNIETDIFTTEWNDYKIYPNPAERTLYVQSDAPTGNDRYQIHNAAGQQVSAEWISASRTPVDVSGYTPGMYFISIERDGQVWKEKFIKR